MIKKQLKLSNNRSVNKINKIKCNVDKRESIKITVKKKS